jgi:hypothetical protein
MHAICPRMQETGRVTLCKGLHKETELALKVDAAQLEIKTAYCAARCTSDDMLCSTYAALHSNLLRHTVPA